MKMKNRLLTLAGALALVAVIGKFYAPPLLAQVRAALVKSVDEPGRVPYQARQTSSQKFGGDAEYAFFPVIPAGKRLVVTHVSGIFNFGKTSPVFVRVFAATPDFAPIGAYPGPYISLAPIFKENTIAEFSSPIQFYVDEGLAPSIFATPTFGNTLATNFTIVGYLVDKSF
jgi:hypothetical protein